MKLEQQVCSLDLAKRLNEMGLRQDSLYRWSYARAWSKSADGGKTPGRGKDFIEAGKPYGDHPAAFTVAELGEMLPEGYGSWLEWEGVWICKEPGSGENAPVKLASTEADARAAMLIHLIENKLITL